MNTGTSFEEFIKLKIYYDVKLASYGEFPWRFNHGDIALNDAKFSQDPQASDEAGIIFQTLMILPSHDSKT